MEYHAALKSKEILMYATTQMNLEDTMLSEISQMKKPWRLYNNVNILDATELHT